MTLTQDQQYENQVRAQRGRLVLNYYNSLEGTDPDSLLTDMLADLMHYCNLKLVKADFDAALTSAHAHFATELKGDL